MSWTRYKAKQLRTGEQEVEDLRDKEQQKCLREMGLNPNDRKRHASQIAKRISREGSRGVPVYQRREQSIHRKNEITNLPVVIHESRTDSDERQHEVETE